MTAPPQTTLPQGTSPQTRAHQPPRTPREVVEKYAKPGPRYTSYPTAPHFSGDPAQLDGVLAAWRQATAPLALYAHVPYCERRCLYCGCHVQIARDRGLGVSYVDELLDELRLLGTLTDLSRPLELMAMGGGTPTWLAPADLRRFIDGVRAQTQPSPDAEWSIEVDPRSVDADYMALLVDLGFNRFSFGVQDLQADVMAAVGRNQGLDEVRAAVEAVGDRPFNLDLMYGLPKQTVQSLLQTIDTALTLAPSRIALFGYAHVPWLKKHQRGMERHGLPGDQERLAMALAARAHLVEAGYEAIGIDHFARPDDELAVARRSGGLHRNFMGYTVRPELDLLAVGVSAISQVAGTFSQNLKDVGLWRARLEAGKPAWERMLQTTADDRLRSAVIMDLMCHFAIDKRAIERRFGVDFDAHFSDERANLAPFIADELLVDTPDRLQLTPLGELAVRNVAMLYDARLGTSQARYSRTV